MITGTTGPVIMIYVHLAISGIAAESIRMETVLKAADFNRLDKTKVSMLIESVYVHKRDPKSGTQAIDITWKF